MKEYDDWNLIKQKTKKGDIENSDMTLQIKTFDKKRLMTRIGMINKSDFELILEKISFC